MSWVHTAYLIGGVAEMRAICVQGGRGGSKKAEKLRAYYINGPLIEYPIAKFVCLLHKVAWLRALPLNMWDCNAVLFFTANTKVWNKSATFCPLLSSLPAHSRPLILFSIDFMSAEGHNFRSLFLLLKKSRDLLWARDITFLTRANRRKNWPSILSGETLKRA